jgi:pimeloyl-ACP methyl ester carboxylesterase
LDPPLFEGEGALTAAVSGRTYCLHMPAVFVHGNPETPAVWDPLLRHLSRSDITALQLPGFGVPAPSGFDATKDDYIAWLAGELEALGPPVDLVGHDWGGLFVLRLACTRPDLLRSWSSDVAGVLHPDYVWHDFAQIWQTPGAGEQWVQDTTAAPREERVNLLIGAGATPDMAAVFADALDAEMGRCILALYRSAAQPAMAIWGQDAEAGRKRPGLVAVPMDDPFTGGPAMAEEMATRMGAEVARLDGLGHWWMLHDPTKGAEILESFWDSV